MQGSCQREISHIIEEEISKEITEVTKNICRILKMQIGLTPADSWCRGKTINNYRKPKFIHYSSGRTKV
jgi:hypothetical protein